LLSEVEEEDTKNTGSPEEETTGPHFQGPASGSPHKLAQNEMNNLVRDLEVPMLKAKLLAHRIKQWKYLDEGMKITLYRYGQKRSGTILHHGRTLVACKVVDGLFKALDISHCSDKWRLFLDFSKNRFKSVLLHNGNLLYVAHEFGIKESDNCMKQLLQYIKYDT